MKCSVKNCSNKIRFQFPKNEKMKKKWLEKIERPHFYPSPRHGLCKNHFTDSDFHPETTEGLQYQRLILKKSAIPSLHLGISTPLLHDPEEHGAEVIQDIFVEPEFDTHEETVPFKHNVEAASACTADKVIEESNSETMSSDSIISANKKDAFSQTNVSPRFTIEEFQDRPDCVLHLTGLENYKKFLIVLGSLGPGVYHLNYENGTVGHLSVSNQFFLVLWKLRRGSCDLELALIFNIQRITVGNLFRTWIKFMANTWSLIDMWPSRELVDFYMPFSFKNSFPKTRGIIDATEIKVDASKNPKQQQALFSTYKNASTVKVVLTTTPGGLISDVSPAYGGSTSDRQILERSELWKKCEPGDLLMGDKGINVQDLFASSGVTVQTPSFVRKGKLCPKQIMKDRALSKNRVHVERQIGLVKTFTILTKKLNHNYICMATEIIQVCVMLSNFKESIM